MTDTDAILLQLAKAVVLPADGGPISYAEVARALGDAGLRRLLEAAEAVAEQGGSSLDRDNELRTAIAALHPPEKQP